MILTIIIITLIVFTNCLILCCFYEEERQGIHNSEDWRKYLKERKHHDLHNRRHTQ